MGVDTFATTLLIRAVAGVRDLPFAVQLLEPGDVDAAPGAAGPSRGEPDRVALVIDASPDAVDPTDAERLVDRLGPRQAGPLGAALPVADEQLGLGRRMLGEPGPQFAGVGEKAGLLGHSKVSWVAGSSWSALAAGVVSRARSWPVRQRVTFSRPTPCAVANRRTSAAIFSEYAGGA